MNYNTYLIKNNSKSVKRFNLEDINNIVSLKEREINILNNKRIYTISTILIKHNSFILKLDFIKVIVTPNIVILFDIENPNVNKFSNFLVEKNLSNSEELYELKFLDIILSYLCFYYDDKLHMEMNRFLKLVNNINNNENNNTNFNSLVNIHNGLINFETKVKDIKDVIDDLLNSDEDMSKLYISIENNPIDKHNEVELILENYDKHIQEILNEISGILKELDINQRVLTLNYANNRNKIAKLNLNISYTSLAISLTGLIPNIFGMNLRNNMENSHLSFLLISFLLLPFVFFISLYFTRYRNNNINI